jgi:regulatory protein YycI of two-component signal transduction system YycFG
MEKHKSLHKSESKHMAIALSHSKKTLASTIQRPVRTSDRDIEEILSPFWAWRALAR